MKIYRVFSSSDLLSEEELFDLEGCEVKKNKLCDFLSWNILAEKNGHPNFLNSERSNTANVALINHSLGFWIGWGSLAYG